MAENTGGPRGNANKWMLGLGAASLVVGGWIVWRATTAAQDKRQTVVNQLSPMLAPAAAPNAGVTGNGTPNAAGERLATVPDSAPAKAAAPAGPHGAADPAKVDQILESAGVYLKRDQTPQAEAILREGVSTYPDDVRLHAAYADLLVTQRRFEDAYAQYAAALSTSHPEGTKPGPEEAKLEFAAGTMASKLGKTQRAMEHYAAAQGADPKNAEYPLYLGQMQRKLGKNDEAKVSLLRAAKLDPSRAIAWGSLADISLRENNVEIALQHIKKARELEPESTVWRVCEARALNRKGEPKAAMDLLIGLSEAEKNQPEVARLIGESLGLMGEKEKAAEWMKKAEKK